MGRITEFIAFINASDKDLEYNGMKTPKWSYAYIDIKDPKLKQLRRKYKQSLSKR
tara:strand:- start:189 stop:353 length:165 start_codon:yes stop_codon:yes gene_type:complete